MTDQFAQHSEGLESPPSHMFAINPDDAQDLPHAVRCLNVASPGTVRLTTIKGDTESLFLNAGTVFPIRARRVWATGTTAAGIVGLY